MAERERLLACTLENTKRFTLDGIDTLARVLDVYDGDTVTLAILFKDEPYVFSARLAGFDACEMRSKHPLLKAKARAARDRVAQLCGAADVGSREAIRRSLAAAGAIVACRCHEFDKYGRPLVTLSAADGRTFGDVLLAEGLAYAYKGKAKPTEEQIAEMLNLTSA